jgi:hypothetical protein
MDVDVVAQRGDYRVRIEPDEDGYASNPREFMATEIVGPDLRRWTVRTERAKFQREFDEIYDRLGGDVFPRYMRIFHDIEVVPVFMYEHSSVALSTGSFIGRAQHAEWDSGQVGFAYITPEKLEETGISDVEGAMSSEVEELGRWMNGEVYGYIVEKKVRYSKTYYLSEDRYKTEDGEEWVEVEDGACWGIIGYEWAEDMGKNALTYELEALAEEA